MMIIIHKFKQHKEMFENMNKTQYFPLRQSEEFNIITDGQTDTHTHTQRVTSWASCRSQKEYEIVLPLWAALEMFVGPATRKISRCQPQHPRGTDTVPVGQSTLQNYIKAHFLTKHKNLVI